MAAETTQTPQSPAAAASEEQSLKYLEFVQVSALQAVLFAAKLYSLAKDNAGPLKPGVQTVEGTVKTVVSPVYNKYQDVPLELLKFVDRKVDESVHKIENSIPPVVSQAFSAAQMAPSAARNVASEVKAAGVVGTASGFAKTVYTKYEPAAKEMYSKYEPVAEQYAASAWRSFNKLPLVPRMTQAVAPAASYYSEMYNQTVQGGAEKGYKVASFLPLVPTARIARVISYSEAKPVVVSN